MMGKFIRGFFQKDYDRFAREIGYSDWKEAEEATFAIFYFEVDGWWSATELPDKRWAVWHDEGQPPYPFEIFSRWEEAISFLREEFDKAKSDEINWCPEGYSDGENIFEKKPDRSKKIY